jgi:hypothetical protein
MTPTRLFTLPPEAAQALLRQLGLPDADLLSAFNRLLAECDPATREQMLASAQNTVQAVTQTEHALLEGWRARNQEQAS